MSNGSGSKGDALPAMNTHGPASEGSGTNTKQRGPVHLQSPQSLERLRERVKKAARELERLRHENAALTERIRQLETRPAVDLDATLLTFDEDPDLLREKVEGFIQAIDAYLAKENE